MIIYHSKNFIKYWFNYNCIIYNMIISVRETNYTVTYTNILTLKTHMKNLVDPPV